MRSVERTKRCAAIIPRNRRNSLGPAVAPALSHLRNHRERQAAGDHRSHKGRIAELRSRKEWGAPPTPHPRTRSSDRAKRTVAQYTLARRCGARTHRRASRRRRSRNAHRNRSASSRKANSRISRSRTKNSRCGSLRLGNRDPGNTHPARSRNRTNRRYMPASRQQIRP